MENQVQALSKAERMVLNKIVSKAVAAPFLLRFLFSVVMMGGIFAIYHPNQAPDVAMVMVQIIAVLLVIVATFIVGYFIVPRSLFKARAKGQLVLQPGVRWAPRYFLLWVVVSAGFELLVGLLLAALPDNIAAVLGRSVTILVGITSVYLANYLVAQGLLRKGYAVLNVKL